MGSEFFDGLKDIAWNETMFKDLQTYDFGNGIFVLRCKHKEPNEHYLLIKAADVDEAISRAVFDLHKPFERMGNVGRMREACQKMRNLIMLRGDGKVRCVLTWDEFNESQKMLRAALAEPFRNCDRFETAEEADAAYRRFYEREIAKIPMDAVDYSKEMAKIPTKDKWLFAPATEEEGGAR